MATIKQKRTVAILLENPRKSVSSAMREAGYSSETAKVPSDLTNSAGWAELMDKFLPDEELIRVHTEGLRATKKQYNGKETVEDPDYAIRERYLELGYKVKKKINNNLELTGKDGKDLKFEVVYTNENNSTSETK